MLISLLNGNDTEFINTDHIVRAVYRLPGRNAVMFIVLTNGTEIHLKDEDAVEAMKCIQSISIMDTEAVDKFVTEYYASDEPEPAPPDTAENQASK